MNELKRPLFWYQGLFLQPQHFQQFDIYLRSLIDLQNKWSKYYFWGVNNLKINKEALKNKIFEIFEAEMIFQDSSYVVFPGTAQIQSRTFKDVELDPENPIFVYLGIKKWNHYEKNVISISDQHDLHNADVKYFSSVEPEEVKDLHHDGKPAQIKYLNLITKILFESEIEKSGDYYLIPIAKLVVDPDTEIISLSKKFVPPVINIVASDILMHLLKNIKEQLVSRSNLLESFKLSRKNFKDAIVDANYLPYYFALRTINRNIQKITHMIESPLVHPWIAYGTLRELVGELSTFTDRINALGQLSDGTELLVKYDHMDLGRCFSLAHQLIDELISTILTDTKNIVHLKREGYYFKAQLSESDLKGGNVYCLLIKDAKDEKKVINSMLNIAKISNSENIDTLITRALPGVQVEYLEVPPAGLPKKDNVFYFKINTKHSQWHEIINTLDFCLFWDDAPEQASAELIILRSNISG